MILNFSAMSFKSSLLAVSVLAVISISCNKNIEESCTDVKSRMNESEYEFLSVGAPSQLTEAQNSMLASSNDFAFSTITSIHTSVSGSYVYSPVSMTCLLGLLSEGADGSTREEIVNALGFSKGGQQYINEFCRNLIAISKAEKELTLELASVVIAEKNFRVLETYKKSAMNWYEAYTVNMDFSDSSSLAAINGWANEKTHGKIPTVLKNTQENVPAIIMNALYFKGGWQEPFISDMTKEGGFRPETGAARKVIFMKQSAEFMYCEGDSYSAVSLPYKGGNIRMTVVLPKSGYNTSELLRGMDSKSWNSLLSSMAPATVNVTLPKFNISNNADMDEILQSLGIGEMFSGNADFSNFSECAIRVAKVFQISNISVDEVGTEAASVSVALTETSIAPSNPVEFNADHPFFFAIHTRDTKSILFAGCFR